MAEDIDTLLEEVENKFIKSPSETKDEKKDESNRSSVRKDSSDFEDILRDVEESAEFRGHTSKLESPALENSGTRCFPVHIGGAGFSNGCSMLGEPRSCSNLHCICCDFPVTTFENFQWVSDTEYIFLRTNMPDFEKVKEKLIPQAGCNAYACQCRHYSTSILLEVKDVPRLSWVCRGHPEKFISNVK